MGGKNTCCSCGGGCCGGPEKKQIAIDFLYLDLEVCGRCQGTDAVLEEAIADVGGVLNAAGMEVSVNKINVATEALAIRYRFESSPTIRVNGKDIDMAMEENRCESCGELCGEDVDCRVWTYQGIQYDIPPKALIVNAILSEVYGGGISQKQKEYVLSKNLEQFYRAMEKKKGEATP